jgi:hypothetical protein
MTVDDFMGKRPTGRSINWHDQRVIRFDGPEYPCLILKPDRVDLRVIRGADSVTLASKEIDRTTRATLITLWRQAGKAQKEQTK